MFQYQRGTDHDLLLAQLWATMRQEDILSEMFFTPPSLGHFLDSFKDPTVLLLESDENGRVWFAAWFEPLWSSALFNVWVREDHRKSRDEMRAFKQAAEIGLQNYNGSLYGITRQASLLSLHEHLGYEILAKLPEVWNGADAWLMIVNNQTLLQDQRVKEAEVKHGRRGSGRIR